MLTTTLSRIRAHGPCPDGWAKLLAGLGKTTADDEPLLFSRIVEINGLDDALWATRAEPQHAKQWRLFAVWSARQVQHLLTNMRSIEALNVAERYAHGMASDAAWAASNAASAAAWAASDAAWAASAAARDAAWAASNAARDAAWDAASAAARDAAWDAAWDAARDAAWDAASDAAWDAASAAQAEKFLEIVGED